MMLPSFVLHASPKDSFWRDIGIGVALFFVGFYGIFRFITLMVQ